MLSIDKYLEKQDDIFDYLQQKMSVEQKQKFQEELKKDPNLLGEVLILKTIRLENEYHNSLEYTNQLKNLMLENPIPPQTGIRGKIRQKREDWVNLCKQSIWWRLFFMYFFMLAFAVFYALIIGGIQISFFNLPLTYLTKEYQLTKEDFNYPHNILRPDNELLRQCLKEYDEQSFGAAVFDFEKYLNDKPFQIEVELPYGIAAFRSEQYEKAITILTPVSESKVERFAAPAKWYLILSYLALHKEKEARETCTQLLDNEQFGGKAKLIYEKIK